MACFLLTGGCDGNQKGGGDVITKNDFEKTAAAMRECGLTNIGLEGDDDEVSVEGADAYGRFVYVYDADGEWVLDWDGKTEWKFATLDAALDAMCKSYGKEAPSVSRIAALEAENAALKAQVAANAEAVEGWGLLNEIIATMRLYIRFGINLIGDVSICVYDDDCPASARCVFGSHYLIDAVRAIHGKAND